MSWLNLGIGIANMISARCKIRDLVRVGIEFKFERNRSSFPSSRGLNFGAFMDKTRFARFSTREIVLLGLEFTFKGIGSTLDLIALSNFTAGKVGMVGVLSSRKSKRRRSLSATLWFKLPSTF